MLAIKRAFGLKSAIFLILLTLPLGAAAEIERTTINLASAFASGHVAVRTAERFKALLEERSGGLITVNIFAGGVMGGEEEIVEATSLGVLQALSGGGMPIHLFAPEYYFFDTPFVMRDWDHLLSVWNSHLGDEVREIVRTEGDLKFLSGPFYRGVRHLTSDRPVRTPEDVRGLKLRLPVLADWIAIWEQIGASAVPIPLHELYGALAAGVADASEGEMEQLWAFKLYEVQPYLTLTYHHLPWTILAFNASYFQGLNEATQALIAAAAQEATAYGTQLAKGREQELLEKYLAQGVTLIEADRAAFAELAAPALERLFAERFTVTTWEEVQAIGR